MRRDQPDKVVLVCQWKGKSDRFFGKYKDFDSGKWLKIPGGVFPDVFDTKDKALLFAAEWYAQAKAELDVRAAAQVVAADATWGAICDAYVKEVGARMRGKASTRYEAVRVTDAYLRRSILATGKPSENDETKCLIWLRAFAREKITKKGASPRARKPTTIRNVAKHLKYLFRLALRQGLIPGMTANPTQGEEFRDELHAIMSAQEQREWLLPLESFAKVLACPEVPSERRIRYLTLGLTGLRPGELAGLQLKHVQEVDGVRFVVVEQQWSIGRGKGSKAKIDSPKTKWGRRIVPVHRALRAPLAAWIDFGWEQWVGRAPKPDDFLFPDAQGKPCAEERSKRFRDDLTAAKCPTEFAGAVLSLYALRHLFSTLLTEGHAHDAAHTRLMGHRPKDTKTLNYSAKLVPFLAKEIESMAFDMPADAPSFGASPSPPSVVTSVVTEEAVDGGEGG